MTPAGGRSDIDREFEQFVRRCSGSLFRTALLLSGDGARAEDLLQMALLRTARRWSTARDAPESYMQRVLVNLSRDDHRRASRRVAEQPLDNVGSLALSRPQSSFDAILERDAVLYALRQLPGRQREVIVLRFYLDLSVIDTAALLGCSQGTVKSYTARAIARLKTLLANPSTIASDRGVT